MARPSEEPVTLPRGITKRGDAYRVSVQVAGKRSTGTALTLTDAIRMVEQIKSGAFTRKGENSTLKTWTLEQAWKAYLEYRTSTSKKATPNQFAWYGRLLMEQLGANTNLDLIKGRVLTEFFDELTVNRNYSASLVNYVGTLLVQTQRFAYERGRMSFTPERMKGRKLTKGRTRFLSDEEELQALDWFERTARESYADLFVFYVDTGCRKTEALNLKWADVDLRTGRITIWQTKNGQPRTIRMTKRVAHILKGRRLASYRSPTQKIFEDISERKFYRVWGELRDALGLSEDNQFVIHMLRHTCCTRLLGAGVDIRSVMEWMGHSSIEITQRYAHFIPSKLDDAVSALDRVSMGKM